MNIKLIFPLFARTGRPLLWLEEESRDEPVIGNANSYGERINNDSFTTREKLMMVIPLKS